MDLESKYENFEKTFENALNAHPPKKTKLLHGNLKPHVFKSLRKAIMKHSLIKNKANTSKTQSLFGISVSLIFQINMLMVTLK